MIAKVELNKAQIRLASSWLSEDCYPYAYSVKGTLWYWQNWYGRPVKGAIKLSSNQLQQLQQLN